MSYLLDVSVLLAKLWKTHEFHPRVAAWMKGKSLAICPISELGFVRISVAAYGADINKARDMLSRFLKLHKPRFVPCDLPVLDGDKAPAGKQTTDFYLASLAERHGLRWATLDENVQHKAALVIPPEHSADNNR